MSDYDMSGLDTGHDGGQDSGYEGHDGGLEQHGLVAAGHEAAGNEHDHYQNHQAFGATHEQEHDEHFQHIRHIEYDDGKGGHYEVTDITVYDEHSESSDAAFGQEYTDAGHDASFHELETMRESFVSEMGNVGHVLGYGHGDEEGGQQALSEVSN